MKRTICILLLTVLYVMAYASDGITLTTVVIDPGHGGKDPGAVSSDKKTYEKTLVLDISKKLAEKIHKSYPDVKVVLTRDSDEFLSLDERATIANKADANLFISIHINSSTSQSPNGYSMHLLGQSSNKDKDLFAYNMDVCKLENSVISLEDDATKYEGFNPDDPESQIFAMLMQSAFLEQSLKFAQVVNSSMKGGPIRSDKGVMQSPFYVLWKTSMPAVLVELGFISNNTDLTSLRKSESREEIASRLFEAFKEYKASYDGEDYQTPSIIEKEPPVESAVAKPKPEPEPETKPAVVPEKKPEPEVKPEIKVEKKTEPEVKPEIKVEKKTEPEVKPEIKVENKQVPEVKPEPQKEIKPAAVQTVRYGVQIFATVRILYPGAKEFLGYKPTMFKVGNLNKYVIGIDENLSTVMENLKEIRKNYSDAFIVKITGDTIEIYRK